tara:strand:- start:7894 stop:9225 length:1332 start_codon:yes stop_codon:yes gene_type:complete
MTSNQVTQKLKVAIVGSGVAGLSAAWLLGKNHDVTLYEKESVLGGHAHTLHIIDNGRVLPVDTGFIVYNEVNYPHFSSLLKHLKVQTTPTTMSFAASLNSGKLEYAGTNLNGLFAQRANILNPSFWRMLIDFNRFRRQGPKHLSKIDANEVSLGQYLLLNNYSSDFVQYHILPMAAAIWSTRVKDIENYPAASFINFFESHGLLKLFGRPQWKTITGGSWEYVRRLSMEFEGTIYYSKVQHIHREPDSVIVVEANGNKRPYDHVVLATHADQALKLINNPDSKETDLLQAWNYTHNTALLHSDYRLMPKNRRAWSSWNFIQREENNIQSPLCVTYWMNSLQHIQSSSPLFLTLNPPTTLKLENVYASFSYRHPHFDSSALSAQKNLSGLQGRNCTWFCGSYFGYGFHEDALKSGLSVAEKLGGFSRPWKLPARSNQVEALKTK